MTTFTKREGTINQSSSTVVSSSQLYSEGGGLRSPEASMLARVIAYGAWRREVMFSRQRILSQLETAAQCLTYSMCQFEAPGGSSLLKLLVTDLWTLLWTILLMHLTRLSSPLLPKKICSVLNVKSRLSRQHILSQLETTVQYSTHTMYRHLCQDEVQL